METFQRFGLSSIPVETSLLFFNKNTFINLTCNAASILDEISDNDADMSGTHLSTIKLENPNGPIGGSTGVAASLAAYYCNSYSLASGQPPTLVAAPDRSNSLVISGGYSMLNIFNTIVFSSIFYLQKKNGHLFILVDLADPRAMHLPGSPLSRSTKTESCPSPPKNNSAIDNSTPSSLSVIFRSVDSHMSSGNENTGSNSNGSNVDGGCGDGNGSENASSGQNVSDSGHDSLSLQRYSSHSASRLVTVNHPRGDEGKPARSLDILLKAKIK